MRARAFTLIELMIVVAIIGLLSAIAIPNFRNFQCRAKQTEGKTGLNLVAKAEDIHRSEFDKYAFGLEAELKIIGILFEGRRLYQFSVQPLGDGYLATGIGLPGADTAGDMMTIDHNGVRTQVIDACNGGVP